jgi:hypothetical protein
MDARLYRSLSNSAHSGHKEATMQDTTPAQVTTVHVQHVIPTKWEQAKAARAARRHQAGAILRSIAEATERQRNAARVQ